VLHLSILPPAINLHRDDVGRAAADSFRLQVVAAKETGTEAPVKRIENCSFLYTRHLNMYFVALTRSNVNPALVFEYIFQLVKILKSYLGEDFDENAMRNNMTLIYELMDETMVSPGQRSGPDRGGCCNYGRLGQTSRIRWSGNLHSSLMEFGLTIALLVCRILVRNTLGNLAHLPHSFLMEIGLTIALLVCRIPSELCH
jgi:hypothetical protein